MISKGVDERVLSPVVKTWIQSWVCHLAFDLIESPLISEFQSPHLNENSNTCLTFSEDYIKNRIKLAQRSENSDLENGQEQREFRQPELQPDIIILNPCIKYATAATSRLWMPPLLLTWNHCCYCFYQHYENELWSP